MHQKLQITTYIPTRDKKQVSVSSLHINSRHVCYIDLKNQCRLLMSIMK